MQITIPYKPREAFRGLHNRKTRWAVVVAHRRAGKTVACVNQLIREALLAKLPNSRYAYIAPFYKQAKGVSWDYFKYFSSFVDGVKINESELRIDFPNGSRITLYGSDKADSLRGLYFDGIVCDEYGDWKHSVWEYVIRPALADRKGWAIIIGTPKGKNEFWKVKCHAEVSANWYCTVIKADESGILDPDEMEELRLELTDDAWKQEMDCDFDAALPGAIFGKELYILQQEGRYRENVYNPELLVHCAMDLGFSDDTALFWFQIAGGVLHVIDCYATNGQGIEHYHKVLKSKPYKYGHWLWIPHDGMAKTLASPRSIEQQLQDLGWNPRKVPNLSKVDGIQAARISLKNAIIDTKCEEGVNALRQYQREYDIDKKCFKDDPRHDWTSHYADAFRYVSIVWREELTPKPEEPTRFPHQQTFNELVKQRGRKNDD